MLAGGADEATACRQPASRRRASQSPIPGSSTTPSRRTSSRYRSSLRSPMRWMSLAEMPGK
jgi:hypothetical protein